MLTTSLIAIACAALGPGPSTAARAANESGYALVITNNRSLEASRPDLHYADDDGAKYADLFAEVFGPDHVTLLTDFDTDSGSLYPGWAGRAKPPTSANLDEAVEALAGRLEADKKAQRPTSVVFVFAGHGDVEHGRGYLELADAKLTSKDLEERVVARLPADRLHIVLDSCNSYFMLNPRKPGGTRFAAGASVEDSLLARHPNVGAIVSTSAEAVTYEWSELQSGIFSYELRSALRGAADVRGDGKVSYDELAAFIRVANEAVANDLYRPKVFAHGPAGKGEEPLLELPPHPVRGLVIPQGPERRITIRDAHGTRLADAHTDGKATLSLLLPPLGEIGIYERVAGDRPKDVFRLAPPGLSALDAITPTPTPMAVRGELPVFSELFAHPFGTARLSDPREVAEEEPTFGASKADVERMGVFLTTGAAEEHDRNISDAASEATLAVVTAAVTYGVVRAAPPSENGWTTPGAPATGFICAGLFGIQALSLVLFGDTTEGILKDFHARDFSSERARAHGLSLIEDELRLAAERDRRSRRAYAGLTLVGAIATATLSVYSATELSSRSPGTYGFNVGLDLGLTAYFLLECVSAWFIKNPVERIWDAYRNDPAVKEKWGEAELPIPVHVKPAVSVTRTGSPVFGVAGTF